MTDLDFHGWQIQPGLRTVQGTLADCLKRLTGEDVLPQGSGRTDAGVHALAQVASVQIESPIPERNLVIALNDVLPPSVRVNTVAHVPDDFHARHSARAKTYRYRIYRGDVCPPFQASYVYHDPYLMDEGALIRSSECIVGKHDFTSFAASDPDRSARIKEAREEDRSLFGTPTNIRTIHSSQWVRTDEELIYTVRGDGFLHHMVRNLVGTFLLVGKGALEIDGRAGDSGSAQSQCGWTYGCAGWAISGQRGILRYGKRSKDRQWRDRQHESRDRRSAGGTDINHADEVQDAVRRAKAAQRRGENTSVSQRVAVLRKFQKLLREQRDSVASLICREAGKPAAEALATEVLVVLDAAEFCIRNAHRFLRDQPLPHGNLAMKTKRGKLGASPTASLELLRRGIIRFRFRPSRRWLRWSPAMRLC